jgi:Cu/Ag efflux protein CusF
MNRTPKMYLLGTLALALLMMLTPLLLANDITGTVVSVNGDNKEFAMVHELEEMNFRLDAYAKVLINGKEANLSDLQSGDEVAVTFELREDERVAMTVRCTRNP